MSVPVPVPARLVVKVYAVSDSPFGHEGWPVTVERAPPDDGVGWVVRTLGHRLVRYTPRDCRMEPELMRMDRDRSPGYRTRTVFASVEEALAALVVAEQYETSPSPTTGDSRPS